MLSFENDLNNAFLEYVYTVSLFFHARLLSLCTVHHPFLTLSISSTPELLNVSDP